MRLNPTQKPKETKKAELHLSQGFPFKVIKAHIEADSFRAFVNPLLYRIYTCIPNIKQLLEGILEISQMIKGNVSKAKVASQTLRFRGAQITLAKNLTFLNTCTTN